ncbi:hypothetical protein BT93_L5603 [Corymbia citriodora subsp. variegata]|uniref:DUF4378 domain-containing protein n=1 Tax=Corymbia citriodora subsp. variegata TaxID=360336 RepID=A0A8T0CRR9_CORYI|nr:hypothetical protein BT93_L5603 [Corymbia citriodora subsp. variegata]
MLTAYTIPMESRPKTDQVKQLGELLQEEQEPFVLEVYLSERWYANRSKSSRRSISSGRQTSRKSMVRLSKLLRTLYSKVASLNEKKHGVKNRERGEETGVADHSTKLEAAEAGRSSLASDVTTAEAGRSSLASDVTTYFSCSESDKEGKPASSENEHASFDPMCLKNLNDAKKGAKDSTIQWSIEKDEEQSDNVSETKQPNYLAPLHDWQQNLQHPPARQETNAPTCKIVLPIKIIEDSIFSASILEKPFRCSKEKQGFTRTEEASQASDSNASYSYVNSKMVLQQTKRLLFDCVKEIIETHERKEKAKRHNRVILGPEEIGKLICDKMAAWGRTSRDETSMTELLYSDYSDTVEEWADWAPQKMQISSKVGDAIVEEITNEIVLDMIDLQLPRMRLLATANYQ